MTYKTVLAIGAILLLEAIALFTGHNGTMYTVSVVTIAGLGGYHIKETLDSFTNNKKA